MLYALRSARSCSVNVTARQHLLPQTHWRHLQPVLGCVVVVVVVVVACVSTSTHISRPMDPPCDRRCNHGPAREARRSLPAGRHSRLAEGSPSVAAVAHPLRASSLRSTPPEAQVPSHTPQRRLGAARLAAVRALLAVGRTAVPVPVVVAVEGVGHPLAPRQPRRHRQAAAPRERRRPSP